MSAGRTLTTGGFMEWWDTSTRILSLRRDDYGAEVLAGAPDTPEGFTLYWTDYVANDWAEHFSDLATALARLACLERGSATEAFFTYDPEEFAAGPAEHLFDTTLEG